MDDSAAILTKNTWVLQSLGDVDLANAFQTGLPELTFAQDSTFTGYTGCNNLRGRYEFEDTYVNINPGPMTRKACPGDGESLFVKGLNHIASCSVEEQSLTFVTSEGQRMVFIPKE